MEKPPTSLDLGGCTVRLLRGGRLMLDGGAMFGIIPRPLWSRGTPPDEQHRIELACNCLLIEWPSAGRRAIVECGHGPKFAAKEQSIYGIDPAGWLRPAVLAAAVDPASIDDVLLTHLHFDHCGGLTWRPEPEAGAASGAVEASGAGGGLQPTFANARVHVQRREFDDARANFGVMKFTYREENYTPIDARDAWVLHDGEAAPLPGVRLLPSPGHTRGHQSVLIEGRDRTLLFLGDVMPTAAHVGQPYNMGYDLFPMDNVATKRKLLAAAAERGWLIVIDHEPRTPLVRVVPDGHEWFRLGPV